MHSLNIVAGLLAALTLAACAGTPDQSRSEQEQIVNSIMGMGSSGGSRIRGEELQCPSNMTRVCSGPDSALVCGCTSSDNIRRMLGSNY